MSDLGSIGRWKQTGVVFANDLGRTDNVLEYTGTTTGDSVWGITRIFDGSPDKIVFPTFSPELCGQTGTNEAVTINIRFKIYSSGTRYILLGNSVDGGGTTRFCLFVESDGYLYTYSASGGVRQLSNVTITPNTDYVLTLKTGGWATNTLSVTLNSTDVTFSNKNQSIYFEIWINCIGFDNLFGGFWMNGDIKEVIIDDRIWTAQEVSDYQTGTTFDYITQKIAYGYNTDGSLCSAPFTTTQKTNILNNVKSDGITPLAGVQ